MLYTNFRWRKVGEISELFSYPIKSCGWIQLDDLDCEILGPQRNNIRDRTFMVISDSGEFVTARKYPKLVQIMPYIDGDDLKISAPDTSHINISFNQLSKITSSRAVIWNESVEVVDCGDAVSKWISEFILSEKSGLRLVYYRSSMPSRDVREKNKAFDTTFRKDVGALHDASSFMLINQKSVDDLNSKVFNPVTPLQFRPNFVVIGPDAFEEDAWNYIKIGKDVILQNVKPCSRYLEKLNLFSNNLPNIFEGAFSQILILLRLRKMNTMSRCKH